MSINSEMIFSRSIEDYNKEFSKGKFLNNQGGFSKLGAGERFRRAIGSTFNLCESTTRKCTRLSLSQMNFWVNNQFKDDRYRYLPKFINFTAQDNKIFTKWKNSTAPEIQKASGWIFKFHNDCISKGLKPGKA